MKCAIGLLGTRLQVKLKTTVTSRSVRSERHRVRSAGEGKFHMAALLLWGCGEEVVTSGDALLISFLFRVPERNDETTRVSRCVRQFRALPVPAMSELEKTACIKADRTLFVV
ncbi:UNVERIFIED_CONTAM: hypothetical protein K2H54_012220 [Gekko kuhli]